MSVLMESELPLPLYRRGKVRDVYELEGRLLIVSSDRISAFDFVLPNGIPDKGKVLNLISAFWFCQTADILPNHVVRVIDSPAALQEDGLGLPQSLVSRSMLVAKADRIPVECVVRGFLAGSAWNEYVDSGTVAGKAMPPGMQQSQELPEPLFTPTTKSETEHDRPLTEEDVNTLGLRDMMPQLEARSLEIYRFATDYARSKGILVADTKFEFGLVDGRLTLIDELLTPDSSRFWSADSYTVGRSQPSFDKQPVRDWLASSGWNGQPPLPELPTEVIEATSRRYRAIYERFTGEALG
ncbi:MAG: phosphoribosylaminoimidazolesuccinocarboxamide synthase [Chloroflexota bacterium]